MSDKPKRRGRPRGSKNIKAPEVELPLATCPKCGSTAVRRRPGARVVSRTIPAVAPNGVAYAGQRWIPSRCDACGQCLVVREFFNEGARIPVNGGGK